jgi:hypothetical protein
MSIKIAHYAKLELQLKVFQLKEQEAAAAQTQKQQQQQTEVQIVKVICCSLHRCLWLSWFACGCLGFCAILAVVQFTISRDACSVMRVLLALVIVIVQVSSDLEQACQARDSALERCSK